MLNNTRNAFPGLWRLSLSRGGERSRRPFTLTVLSLHPQATAATRVVCILWLVTLQSVLASMSWSRPFPSISLQRYVKSCLHLVSAVEERRGSMMRVKIFFSFSPPFSRSWSWQSTTICATRGCCHCSGTHVWCNESKVSRSRERVKV